MRRILVVLLLSAFACVGHVSANLSKFEERDDAILQQMTARFYNGNSINNYVDFPMTELENLVDRADFSTSRKTVFIIHGYTENLVQPSVVTMVNAYLAVQSDVNLVGVDWSNLSDGDYLTVAVANTRKVGRSLAIKIKQMVDKGLKMSLLHLVGHSLGGQLSGFIGKNLQSAYNLKPNRISALDPAGPGFYPLSASNRLDAADAIIVDSILTNPYLYGYPLSIGSATFWPNPGTNLQPGCPDVPVTDTESFCSHRRSWMYWAESLRTPDIFQAYNKDQKTYATMGDKYDGINKGDFRLKTDSKSPFGLGPGGIIS
ncbi:lipase member H-like [Arctopsyche grandis]|uniref:lipase member H-like n=1 Tax=Arctopsyche grandis TaxID=121162 RepID=UPI00406D7D49